MWPGYFPYFCYSPNLRERAPTFDMTFFPLFYLLFCSRVPLPSLPPSGGVKKARERECALQRLRKPSATGGLFCQVDCQLNFISHVLEKNYFSVQHTNGLYTGWLDRTSHRKQNRGRISMHQVGQRIAPSILFPVRRSVQQPSTFTLKGHISDLQASILIQTVLTD